MITNTKQSWKIGDKVSVGFMKNLTVIDIKPVYDYLPDIYILESIKGIKYQFIPHNGLTKLQ